ncbi:MAG: Ig-like domain-containing protein, partial [Oscillospiraceae bacterium]|nr:Ig-like domain-containing protein [Oscillospiraceae bacterium]
ISKNPSNAAITWTSGTTAKATVSATGAVTGVAAGESVVTASITVDGQTYTDTCTVTVVAAS